MTQEQIKKFLDENPNWEIVIDDALQTAPEADAPKPEPLHPFLTPIGEMVERVSKEPPIEMVYPGMVEGTKIIVFGASKSGKTMWCENFLISIAAGLDSYLGQPLNFKNRRVLFISLEEYYSFRTTRNSKQLDKLTQEQQEAAQKNYIVVNENMPLYISTDQDWQLLADMIKSVNAGAVVIDSLTRLYRGSIEDSNVAMQITERLRRLTAETKTTIIIIHHTHKLYGRAITMDTMAGSRILSQEVDTMIGINRTPDGKHYIKEVAFRYAPCINDTVKTFTIDANYSLNITGQADEAKLLEAADGRKDEGCSDKIYDFLREQKEEGNDTIAISLIENEFVSTDVMSKQTVFNCLSKLMADKKIKKLKRGVYTLIA